jgi:phosphoglycerol transferase MdoB-like AlkP superfamily enzyme
MLVKNRNVARKVASFNCFLPEPVTIITFLFCSLGGFLSHTLILLNLPEVSYREFHNLVMGLSYDLMNAAEVALIAFLISLIFFNKAKKVIHGIFLTLFLFFLFIDLNYVFQFGTHLPFSTIEYLSDLSNFSATIQSVLLSRNLWVIVIIPVCLYLFFLIKITVYRNSSFLKAVVNFFVTILLLIFLTGIFGVYPNAYVSKNLNDPLTSSAGIYFYWSRNIEKESSIEKPTDSIQKISETLTGLKPAESRFEKYPLVRSVHNQSCQKVGNKKNLSSSICGKNNLNILFLFLESFRAVEVGAYGSELKVTPHFDNWSQKGVFFENFYANGFQTRHGQVAVYCSMMPNYSGAIMKKYPNNYYYCLPEHLKKMGYSTSWVFGSDAAFDNQISFLPKIGIDKIYDKFSFDADTETLGWGYSDKAMFEKWVQVLDNEPEPFFSSALTITNHHPFDVPQAYKLHQGQDDTHKYYEAMYYTDGMLNEFLLKIQKKKWYQNTLIFIFADTANYQKPQAPYKDFEDFIKTRSQIPMLVLGGPIKHPFVEKRYFSQIDLAPTVMDLLGSQYLAPWTGVSMIDANQTGIAYTNRPGNYWAVMSQKGRYYNEANQTDHYFGFNDNQQLKRDYKKLGQSWLEITKWLLQENLYWNDNEK